LNIAFTRAALFCAALLVCASSAPVASADLPPVKIGFVFSYTGMNSEEVAVNLRFIIVSIRTFVPRNSEHFVSGRAVADDGG